ncbi:hypothetical protein CXB51_025206 [Gossypium anomalum]|uniref:Uncharacterized protein n=1 Tax=Gossypium anomalum TaxID=47600 RepID=A0A8J5YDW1_9ROSI|nr:hypothetical protein CXB51_025206 [Gossypium anomalum]
MSDEVLNSGSLTEKKSRKNAKEGRNKMRIKRKKSSGWRVTPSRTMMFLCWNYHRIGNPATIRHLKQLIVVTNPNIVFLCETKVRSNETECIRIRCHIDSYFVVAVNGCRDGLKILWKEEVKVTVKNFSDYHIDSLVSINGMDDFHFTGFYGFAEEGRRKPDPFMENFCSILDDLSLVDIKSDKGWFTKEPGFVRERLDRFVAWVQKKKKMHESISLLKSCRKELGRLYTKEESYWALLSHISWLKDGDRNTRFFHARATGTANVCRVAQNYFQNLFWSNATLDDRDLSHIQLCISSKMNASLMGQVTDKEIIEAFS